MAAVSAPLEKVEEVLASINGYVVIANINSPIQSVIGGATSAVDEAITKFTADGFQAVKIPVSHAFHTKIVAPASVPLKDVIAKMTIQPPTRTIVANVTGDIYPTTKDEIVDLLAAQVASPVQFVKSMKTLYNLGGRVFVEIGPKRVLNSLASDNLKEKSGVALLSTNHPRKGGKASFNEALCGLYAAGIGGSVTEFYRTKFRQTSFCSITCYSQKRSQFFRTDVYLSQVPSWLVGPGWDCLEQMEMSLTTGILKAFCMVICV